MRGDFVSPGPWLEEARTLYHELGDQYYEAFVLESFGVLADRQGDYQQAIIYFEAAIAIFDKAGGFWAPWPRTRIGHAYLREGKFAQARAIFELTIQEFQTNDSFMGVVYTIEGLASLHVKQGRFERATRLFTWTDAKREELGNKRPAIEQGDVDECIATCLARMGETPFSDAYEEGRKMLLEEAVACALEES
jgi:tetratricopeptide (TPR) repeat protein